MPVVPAIPASQIVSVTPSVLPAGGSALDLIGLFLTTSTRTPIGTVQSFANSAAVASYFGSTSNEAALAAIYFLGFDNSNLKPGNALFTQYNTSDVAAYLRGGVVSGLNLTQLQLLSCSLSITINGTAHNGAPNLGTATSFSSAATIIGDVLNILGAQAASANGSITTTTLTIGTLTSGTISIGQIVQGTGVTVGTYITALGTGTGGVGTYTVTPSQTALTEAITTFAEGVTYDSVSGAFVVTSNTTGTGSTLAFATGSLSGPLKLTQGS